VNYAFGGALKNLRIQLLVAAKFNDGNTYNDYRYKINKTDMVNYNLVLNYLITNKNYK
jgi:hypothetical protein